MVLQKNSLEKLFVETIRDLYDAEHQITEALPKMAQAASATDLKTGLQQHLDQTRTQTQRLEEVFQDIGERPSRKKCFGMEGLIKEGEQNMKEMQSDKDGLDASLIASAQKVEHYEISGYGTAKAYAETLGHYEAARLLDQTLSEEVATDKKLTTIAETHINPQATH